MTSRYKPNEAVCPVPLDLLALLLRSEEARVAEIVMMLPALQRASLAAFCFSRCHMRALGLQIAAHCDEHALDEAAGSAGEVLFELSRNRIAFDVDPVPFHKRKVSLARISA